MEARATVIIPTFGEAGFTRWAIKSVQQQTVKDIEICVICDGSSSNMVSFFKSIEHTDPRIRVFTFPKSPRCGEPYRDIAIQQTTGRIICYCCHDDLWLPNHIEVMEEALQSSCFTHTLHAYVNLPEAVKDENSLLGGIHWIKLNPEIIEKMQRGHNYFGLTFGAHTRKSYYKLEERWVTTPVKNCPTDLYMWRKFLTAFGENCKTIRKVTALNFPQIPRKNWTEQERDDELKRYFDKIQDTAFLKTIEKLQSAFRPTLLDKLNDSYKKHFKTTKKYLRMWKIIPPSKRDLHFPKNKVLI